MIDKKIGVKTVGICILIPCFLALIGVLIAFFFLTSFGFASGVSFSMMLPFLLLSILTIIVCSIGIYVSIRYLRNRPFKRNKSLGSLFMIFSVVYFVLSLFSFIASNLTGNTGGWLRPIFAFLILVILLPLGMGIRNGYK
jgi:hypothetical protein